MKAVFPSIFLAMLLVCVAVHGSEPTPVAEPDKDGLEDLIRNLQHGRASSDMTAGTTVETIAANPSNYPIDFSDVTVPAAHETWQLSDHQCLEILKKADIQTHPPSFATPFVKTPLLLDGDIEGVVIDSRWPKEQKRRVMDCRLIVSLIQLARRARQAGVVKIEYYSSWRPVTVDCPKGLRGRRCRLVLERAQRGQLPSQHSRATAIDMRWFTFEDGIMADVLAHYEMNFHEPPCDDHPETWQGQFLQKLACDLHGDKVFNVMLTPNANRDHRNHFHFDITPNVKWYILR